MGEELAGKGRACPQVVLAYSGGSDTSVLHSPICARVGVEERDHLRRPIWARAMSSNDPSQALEGRASQFARWGNAD